jgi:hypothetical protein
VAACTRKAMPAPRRSARRRCGRRRTPRCLMERPVGATPAKVLEPVLRAAKCRGGARTRRVRRRSYARG